MTWAAFLAGLVGLLKQLLIPLAFLVGKKAGLDKAADAQTRENAELMEKYMEIALKGIDDTEVDKRLDEGTI